MLAHLVSLTAAQIVTAHCTYHLPSAPAFQWAGCFEPLGQLAIVSQMLMTLFEVLVTLMKSGGSSSVLTLSVLLCRSSAVT